MPFDRDIDRAALIFGGLAFALIALLAAVVVFGGCAATTSRPEARAAVLAMGAAVKAADETCAKVALERRDVDLARRCEETYNDARDALVKTAETVDAWNERPEVKRDVRCTVARTARDLTSLTGAIEARGGRLPPLVHDALTLAGAIGDCR